MKVTTLENDTHTTMPYSLRLMVAEGIQAERPWSDLDPKVIVEEVYKATEHGCLDVYVYTDDDNLAAVAHIGRTFDVHVGDLVMVWAVYVWPEYRDTNAMRIILRVAIDAARLEGVRWCGYTHWTQPCVQEYRYIDLERRTRNVRRGKNSSEGS